MEEFIGQVRAELRLMRDEVRGLRDDIRQTKGFISGVLWCLTGLAATAGFIWGIFSS